ncbi:amino acid permease-like protein [Motilibacter rhizosphaerae]|uniref:glutamate decarboxylase n=2 Tax=Motilibacter rhizosphaerae TaxID=598652 RepID=A0A4Q7NWF6_9ACTN|nr:amino acid permease-like protein [Motilibacter rhizosphaerae]
MVQDELMLDGTSRMNLATFCTTWVGPAVAQLMAASLDKNIVDKDEYPHTAELEARCVQMLADLWCAPSAERAVGTSTTGSSEAAMLGGLAARSRWRSRRRAAGLDAGKPNLVCGPVQVCWEGALGGALAWIGGPSRALLVTAEDGALPPFLDRTNRYGAQRNILLVQGAVVTAISVLHLVMDDVSSASFPISALVVSLYIVMYMMLFAAAIRLRHSQPDLPRAYRIAGGTPGMWLVAGTGLLAVGFALVLAFVPPDQLPIGSAGGYVALVAVGTLLFTGLPLVLDRYRRPEWRVPSAEGA